MKINIVLMALLVAVSSNELQDCLEAATEMLKSPLSSSDLLETAEECASLLTAIKANAGSPNLDLQLQMQTALVLTDFALIFYSRFGPISAYVFAYAKTIKDFYNWLELVDLASEYNDWKCLIYNFKMLVDIWDAVENTFTDSSVMLLDYLDLKEYCPNSPVIKLFEVTSKELVPTQQKLEISPVYGMCTMRVSFAVLSLEMTANMASTFTNAYLFLNYAATIFRTQSARQNCQGLII